METYDHVPRSHHRLSAPAELLGGRWKREGRRDSGPKRRRTKIRCSHGRHAAWRLSGWQKVEKPLTGALLPSRGVPTSREQWDSQTPLNTLLHQAQSVPYDISTPTSPHLSFRQYQSRPVICKHSVVEFSSPSLATMTLFFLSGPARGQGHGTSVCAFARALGESPIFVCRTHIFYLQLLAQVDKDWLVPDVPASLHNSQFESTSVPSQNKNSLSSIPPPNILSLTSL